MNLCMFVGTVAMLLLKQDMPLTLKFEEPISFHTIGKAGRFQGHKSKDKKILVITPLAEQFDVPMVAISESGTSYNFRLKSTKDRAYAFRNVIQGIKKDIRWKTLLRKDGWTIKEGSCGLKLYTSQGKAIEVNGEKISNGVEYLPKGSAVFINGEEIL